MKLRHKLGAAVALSGLAAAGAAAQSIIQLDGCGTVFPIAEE